MGFGKWTFKKQVNKDWDKLVQQKIINFQGTFIKGNENSKLFIDVKELGGFNYIEVNIISPFNVKTLKGVTLTLNSGSDSETFESDSLEVETDFSHSTNMGISIVDFDIEDSFLEFLKTHETIDMKFSVGKESVDFKQIDTHLLLGKVSNN